MKKIIFVLVLFSLIVTFYIFYPKLSGLENPLILHVEKIEYFNGFPESAKYIKILRGDEPILIKKSNYFDAKEFRVSVTNHLKKPGNEPCPEDLVIKVFEGIPTSNTKAIEAIEKAHKESEKLPVSVKTVEEFNEIKNRIAELDEELKITNKAKMNIMIIPSSITVTKKALGIKPNQIINITGQSYIHNGTYFNNELSRTYCRDDAIFVYAEDINIVE